MKSPHTQIDERWDVPTIRVFVREHRFDADQSKNRRQPGLDRRLLALRFELRDLLAEDMTEPDRRWLRLLFKELTQLAEATSAPTASSRSCQLCALHVDDRRHEGDGFEDVDYAVWSRPAALFVEWRVWTLSGLMS